MDNLKNKTLEELEAITDSIRKENNRLLELCMYALIRDTNIYNRELDDINKLKFMSIIKNNLNDDTYTLRQKLINVWTEYDINDTSL